MSKEVVKESPIETALAKENVTNQVIQRLKDNYLGLKINGLEDKAGFKAVEDARKECKQLRTLAVRICKSGREEAIQIQKDWIAKEKEVVASIEEVESYLEKQSDAIKELEKQILFEAAQKAKLPARKEKLATIGIELQDEELLKIDDTQFNALYNEFYIKYLEAEQEKARIEAERKAEAERLENERLEKLANDRRIEIAPYVQFISGNNDLRSMSEDDYNTLLKSLQQAKIDFDAEQKRIAEENARLKAEAEAKEKQLEIEREEARKKQAAIEAQRLAEQEKADKLLEAQRKEAEAKAKKLKAEADAKLKAEQEAKAKLEAELKAKRDAEAKAEQERIEAEKQRIADEKKLAAAPDKQKIELAVKAIEFLNVDNVITLDAKDLVNKINVLIGKIKDFTTAEIEKL